MRAASAAGGADPARDATSAVAPSQQALQRVQDALESWTAAAALFAEKSRDMHASFSGLYGEPSAQPTQLQQPAPGIAGLLRTLCKSFSSQHLPLCESSPVQQMLRYCSVWSSAVSFVVNKELTALSTMEKLRDAAAKEVAFEERLQGLYGAKAAHMSGGAAGQLDAARSGYLKAAADVQQQAGELPLRLQRRLTPLVASFLRAEGSWLMRGGKALVQEVQTAAEADGGGGLVPTPAREPSISSELGWLQDHYRAQLLGKGTPSQDRAHLSSDVPLAGPTKGAGLGGLHVKADHGQTGAEAGGESAEGRAYRMPSATRAMRTASAPFPDIPGHPTSGDAHSQQGLYHGGVARFPSAQRMIRMDHGAPQLQHAAGGGGGGALMPNGRRALSAADAAGYATAAQGAFGRAGPPPLIAVPSEEGAPAARMASGPWPMASTFQPSQMQMPPAGLEGAQQQQQPMPWQAVPGMEGLASVPYATAVPMASVVGAGAGYGGASDQAAAIVAGSQAQQQQDGGVAAFHGDGPSTTPGGNGVKAMQRAWRNLDSYLESVPPNAAFSSAMSSDGFGDNLGTAAAGGLGSGGGVHAAGLHGGGLPHTAGGGVGCPPEQQFAGVQESALGGQSQMFPQQGRPCIGSHGSPGDLAQQHHQQQLLQQQRPHDLHDVMSTPAYGVAWDRDSFTFTTSHTVTLCRVGTGLRCPPNPHAATELLRRGFEINAGELVLADGSRERWQDIVSARGAEGQPGGDGAAAGFRAPTMRTRSLAAGARPGTVGEPGKEVPGGNTLIRIFTTDGPAMCPCSALEPYLDGTLAAPPYRRISARSLSRGSSHGSTGGGTTPGRGGQARGAGTTQPTPSGPGPSLSDAETWRIRCFAAYAVGTARSPLPRDQHRWAFPDLEDGADKPGHAAGSSSQGSLSLVSGFVGESSIRRHSSKDTQELTAASVLGAWRGEDLYCLASSGTVQETDGLLRALPAPPFLRSEVESVARATAVQAGGSHQRWCLVLRPRDWRCGFIPLPAVRVGRAPLGFTDEVEEELAATDLAYPPYPINTAAPEGPASGGGTLERLAQQMQPPPEAAPTIGAATSAPRAGQPGPLAAAAAKDLVTPSTGLAGTVANAPSTAAYGGQPLPLSRDAVTGEVAPLQQLQQQQQEQEGDSSASGIGRALSQGLNVARRAADTAQAVQTADSMLPSQLAPGQLVQGVLPSQAQGFVSGSSVPAALAGAASTVVAPLTASGVSAAATAAQLAGQGVSAPATATQLAPAAPMMAQGPPAAATAVGSGALSSAAAAGVPITSAASASPASAAGTAGPAAAAAIDAAASVANQASAALAPPTSLASGQLPQPLAVQQQMPQQLRGLSTQPMQQQVPQQLVQPGSQQLAQAVQQPGTLPPQPALQPQQVAGHSLGPQTSFQPSGQPLASQPPAQQLAPQQLAQQPLLLQSQPQLVQPVQPPTSVQAATQMPALPASTAPRGIQPPTAAQVQQTAAPLQRAADTQLQRAMQSQSGDPQWVNRAAEFYARNGQQAAAESLKTLSGPTSVPARPTGAAPGAAAAAFLVPATAGAQPAAMAPQAVGAPGTAAQFAAPAASSMSAAQLSQPAARAAPALTRGEAAAQAAIAAIGPSIDPETAELARSTGAAGSYRRFPVGPPLPAPPPSAFASAPPLTTGQMQAACFAAPVRGAVGQPSAYTQQPPASAVPAGQALQPAQASVQAPSFAQGPPDSDLQGEGEVWVPLQDSQQMLWVQEGTNAPMRVVSARTMSVGSAAEGQQLEGTQPGAASTSATAGTTVTSDTGAAAAPAHGWGPMKTLSRLLHHKKPAAAT